MKLPFIEIIEWVEHTPNLLMWKFPDADAEIKNGARLTVRESEKALLLNEGVFADEFGPGLHKLSTSNVPILSRLRGWKYGFESPFKADVYFFSSKQFVNLKWGTPAPILMRDPQFGQVRVRAFGTYSVRITDIQKFFKEYSGTYPALTIFELEHQLRDFIAPRFGQAMADANIAVLDAAGSLDALNKKVQPLIQPYFTDFGIEVTQFTISSITLPDEVTKFYDNITNMNMVTDMDKFTKFNTANAIGQQGTSVNSGTQEAAALGIMLNALNQQTQKASPDTGTSTNGEEDITAKLKKLKTLFENELISEEEYKTKKAELLKLL